MGKTMMIDSVKFRDVFVGGADVVGRFDFNFTFKATVFPNHLEHAFYEYGESKMSKIEISTFPKKEVVFHFDRSVIVPAKNLEVEEMVHDLVDGLSSSVFHPTNRISYV